MDAKPRVYVAKDTGNSRAAWLLFALLICGVAALGAWYLTSPRRNGAVSVAKELPSAVASLETPVAVTPPVPPKPEHPQTVLAADFNTGNDGFVFVPDAFRKTMQPNYAQGTLSKTGGLSGGALNVRLGGRDSRTVAGMSGGWRKEFALRKSEHLQLTFSLKLTQSTDYENDEYSQALLLLDGAAVGDNGQDYLAQVQGNGNGGPELSSGWKTYAFNLGEISAGTHTLTVGAYNNKKTAQTEITDFLIDDVSIQTGASAKPQRPSRARIDSQRVPDQEIEF